MRTDSSSSAQPLLFVLTWLHGAESSAKPEPLLTTGIEVRQSRPTPLERRLFIERHSRIPFDTDGWIHVVVRPRRQGAFLPLTPTEISNAVVHLSSRCLVPTTKVRDVLHFLEPRPTIRLALGGTVVAQQQHDFLCWMFVIAEPAESAGADGLIILSESW